MRLSPDRNGKFTASRNFCLMAASGQVDWTPDREGAKGVGYTVWTNGKQYIDTVFATVAEYDNFIKSERARLGEFTLGAGAKTYAEEKAMELLFGEDEYEPQLQTLDIKRGNDRESGACADLAMRLDTDLFFTGDMIGAPEAFRLGAIERVVPRAELRDTALVIAAKIAAKSPAMIRIAKEALTGIEDGNLEDKYRWEQGFTLQAYMSPDSAETRDAFVEKRDAKF